MGFYCKISIMRAAKSFDVICTGAAQWNVTGRGVRPHGGPVNVAIALARAGLRIGLATVVADDALGRATIAKVAATGVDVGGVTLTQRRAGLLLVDATGAATPVPASEEERPVQVPLAWSSDVLLISGISPVVSQAAALCKAARRARRQGTLVVIDLNPSLHVWVGRDPRTIQMVLREVDVARCSVTDLAVIGTDVGAVRTALRKGATLVVSDSTGGAVATGPFGEVAFIPPKPLPHGTLGVGAATTAAICEELTRAVGPGESASAIWDRALRRGYAALVG